MKLVNLKRIPMKGHPDLTERWLEDRVSEDPDILGLGRNLDVIQRQKRLKPGVLGLLLADSDGQTRYEVELMLGATDESHIIRTLEYWDLERRRYPQYDHVAVIVAEEITNRFFNVISLFNGFLPIMPLQVSALEISDQEIALVFTKVLDRQTMGEEPPETVVNRAYWEKRSTPAMLTLADQILELIRQMDKSLHFKYNKHFLGLA